MRLLRPSASALRDGRAAARARVRRRRGQPEGGDDAEHAPGGILAGARGIRAEPGRHGGPSKTSRRRCRSATRCSAGIAPAQANCNYLTLAFRNVASLESENIGVGTVARAGFVLAPTGPNNEGFPSSAPANGPSIEHGSTAPRSSTTTTCTRTPTRTSQGPGSRRCAKPATRPTLRAGDDRQLPRRACRTTANSRPAKQNSVRRKVPRRDAEGARSEQGEEQMSRLRWWRRHDEVPVVELQRSNPVRFGIVLMVLLALVIYFGFTKHIPFKHGFRLKAQFATALNIQPKSPGAHRGRRRRQGQHDQARRQDRPRDDGNRIAAACRSTPTRRSRSARGSSSKATGSSNCSPAARRRRRSPRGTRSRSRRPPTRCSSTRCSTR